MKDEQTKAIEKASKEIVKAILKAAQIIAGAIGRDNVNEEEE